MNFKEAETFKESEEAKTAPKVDFGNSTTKEVGLNFLKENQ